ncbi:MAG: hypothetical protein IKG93_06055 [Clostridiales bacterium]|nr:hypothetical protein [Clostridiales bacterium]
MIKIIGLWIVGILFSLAGIVAKEQYQLAQRIKNFFLTVFLFLTLLIQLNAIYSVALKSPFVAVIAIAFFDIYWFYFAPFHPNSDAAGNGMAMGFRSLFNNAAGIFLGVISYLFIKFFKPDGRPWGLYIVLAIAACIGIRNILVNRYSYLYGDEFDEKARWAHIRREDYRKSLFRAKMLEKNDAWEGKELDAAPVELTHWIVFDSNEIMIQTFRQLCCFPLEGRFAFETGTVEMSRTGLISGRLGYARKLSGIDTKPSFVPSHVVLAWYDLSDGKTYKLEADLPGELNHYFDDTERFDEDDIEFRILPKGKVVMFHNRHNQIHNIMLDHPLQGQVTNEYEQAVSEFLKEKESYIKTHERIGEKIDETIEMPSLDTLDNYMKRFHYTIRFQSENNRYNITKIICNFINGEKILSSGEWKEEMDPARLKDVFLRFEDKIHRYSCFVYFNEAEILRFFDEVFAKHDEPSQVEFIIQVGDKKNDFSFSFKAGEQYYPLKETEIRLYMNDEEDEGMLVFKNYRGKRKNLLHFMSL